MKKLIIISSVLALLLVILFVIGALVFYNAFFPDGKTFASRQQQVMDKLNGSWYIGPEQEIENYIVCGIYQEGGEKAGIAIFEEQKNGNYKFISRKIKSNDDVIITGFSYKGEKWYDIAWFNGVATKYAEMTYTIGDEVLPYKFETGKSALIYNSTDAKEYTLDVAYYDNDGNKYE